MDTVTLVLNAAPYGDEKVWNALRLAKALMVGTEKMKVNVFLLGDAVSTAKKGQKPPEDYYNLEEMLKELVDHGAQVVACRTCTSARGLTREELLPGVRTGTTTGDLVKWIKESQKVLTF